MAKTLKKVLEQYKPKAADEQKFVDKHVIVKHDDANGNKDDVFQGTNVKKIDRKKERHGYDTGADEKVYEEKDQVSESLPANANAGDYVKDFKKSNAPQFKGKSKEKRRVMAIAAYLNKEEVEHVEEGAMDKIKSAAKKALEKMGGGTDTDQLKNLQKKMGVPQTGKKPTNEEVEPLQEGEMAHAQFQKYHADTAKLLKNIHQGLSKHYDIVASKKGFNNGQAHWGHVGDIKDIHRTLQDIHDRVLQNGEYSKPVTMTKEDVDVTLLSLYANLDEENRTSMLQVLDEGRREELVEFALSLRDD